MYLIVMVLADGSRLDEVVAGWVKAGIQGVTILESRGLNRQLIREQAHLLFAGFTQLFTIGWMAHHTLFALAPSLEAAEAAVAATEKLLGPMDDVDNGIIFLLPAAKVWGARRGKR